MANSKRKAHCGKVQHRTLEAAQIALRRTIATTSRRGEPIVTGLSAYKCAYCDGWHVGRSSKKGIDWEAVAAFEKAQQARFAANKARALLEEPKE